MPPVLQLRDVSLGRDGRTVLDSVTLDVGEGQVHGVVGPNGAGKTTLLDVACGLVRPDRGDVVRRGEPLPLMRHRDLPRVEIARTLQTLELDERRTVLDNIVLGADHQARPGVLGALVGRPRSSEDPALRERARVVLDELRIGMHARELPASLPLAVRKRVDLARALVTNPSLLVLDEPAAGLSSPERDELVKLLRSLARRMSVVLVEHHLDVVSRVCNEVTVLDDGRVVARGPFDVVRDDPAAAAAYFGQAAG